jgi:hypothetical protein
MNKGKDDWMVIRTNQGTESRRDRNVTHSVPLVSAVREDAESI